MIRFFRSSFVSQYVVIALTGLLLWSRALIDPHAMPAPEGPVPLYKILYFLFESMPAVSVAIAFFLTLFSAFYLNHLLTFHEIVSKNASLPAFIFIVLISYYPAILTLHPVNISIVFLLLILQRLFTVYRKSDPLDTTFGVGFLTAVASLFYFPFIFFFILILVALFLFRVGGWREWLSTLLGLITPFLFVFVYYFWFDQLQENAIEYLQVLRLNFPLDSFKNPSFLLLTIIMMILLITGLLSGLSHLNEKTLEIRRKISILIWMLPVILAGFYFSDHFVRYHLIFSFITVAALFSAYLLKLKKPFRQEIILVIIFAAILLNNLFHILA